MKLPLLVGLLLLALPAHALDGFVGRVLGVRSGDAVVVTSERGDSVVRLHGIEWTKTNLLLQTRTRDYLRRRLGTGKVKVAIRSEGPGKLLYADLFLIDERGRVQPEPVSVELTRKGLARWSSQFAVGRNDIRSAESEARIARRGLWSDQTGANVALPSPRTSKPLPTPKPRPTPAPTSKPTPRPTPAPTATPAPTPSPRPTAKPTPAPTSTPAPTPKPTAAPTAKPTVAPTAKPARTPAPTVKPSPHISPNTQRLGTRGRGASGAATPTPGNPVLRAITTIGWPLGGVLVGLSGWLALPVLQLRSRRRTPISALKPGLVQLKGIAKLAEAPLATPTGGIPALLYREEAWRYIDGKWNPIRNDADAVPFLLDDGTGTVRIEAKIGDFQTASPITRFYNGVHVAQWPTPPYESDERAQVVYLAPETQVLVQASAIPDGSGGFTLLRPTVVQGNVKKASNLRARLAAGTFLLALAVFAGAILALSFLAVEGLPPKR